MSKIKCLVSTRKFSMNSNQGVCNLEASIQKCFERKPLKIVARFLQNGHILFNTLSVVGYGQTSVEQILCRNLL